MVSAEVAPATAAMSMPRAAMTTVRTWSPSWQRSRRASSGEHVTQLGRLLVRIGLIGHRSPTDLGAGQVLEQARRPQRWMELEMERILGVLADRGLVHGHDVGHTQT